jgi:NADH-quinone oxidoreductase subunit A
MDYGYGLIGIFILFAIVFVIFTIFFAGLLRPQRPNKTKLENYECGEVPMGGAWIQYNIGFYTYALIFVIFDVEVVFLFPWAVAFKQLGLFALVEMLIFLAILIVGLAYAWKKGALSWES